MEAVFLKLVNMSLTASWLVLAVLLLRLVLKDAPKYIRVLLWGIVGLRLVFPFSLESMFSLIPSAEPLPQEFLYAATPQVNTGIPAINSAINPIIAESLTPTTMANSANPTQIWSFILSQVWILGVVLMLGYAMVSFLLVRRKVAASIKIGQNLRICDHLDSPFILGIFRPVIYLPSELDQKTADLVLAHEYAHLKRRDHWWKPLGFALLCVYWFNPVMWLAYILLCRDIELACDEKVIRELGTDEKKAYSAALLHCSVPRKLIAACPLAFGEVGVKDRIKSVLNYKKPAFWIILIAVIVCIVFAVCFLTDPEKPTTPYEITKNLTTGEAEWAQVTIWEEETEHISLEKEEIEELVAILTQLEDRDFIKSNVDHQVSLMLHYADKEILLQTDGAYTQFVLDSESGAEIEGTWAVRNDALNAFFRKFYPFEDLSDSDAWMQKVTDALDNLRSLEYYHIQAQWEFSGENVLSGQSYIEYWKSGDTVLQLSHIPDDSSTEAYLWYGPDITYKSITYDGTIDWSSGQHLGEPPMQPWFIHSDPEDHGEKAISCQTHQGGYTIRLKANVPFGLSPYDPDSYHTDFHFTDSGNLESITVISENEIHSMHGTFEILPTSAEQINSTIQSYAPVIKNYEYIQNDTHIRMTVSPTEINISAHNTVFSSSDEIYDSLVILDSAGNPVSLQGTYGGSQGGNLINMEIQPRMPIDVGSIGSITIGEYRLEAEGAENLIVEQFQDTVVQSWQNSRDGSKSVVYLNPETGEYYDSSTKLDHLIRQTILRENGLTDSTNGVWLESHEVLGELVACGLSTNGETIGLSTFYVLAQVGEVTSVGSELQVLSIRTFPVIIHVTENADREMTVTDYWQAEDGVDPEEAIQTNFPNHITEELKPIQEYVVESANHILRQGLHYYDIYPRTAVEELIAAVVENQTALSLSLSKDGYATRTDYAWNCSNHVQYSNTLLDFRFEGIDATEMQRTDTTITMYFREGDTNISFVFYQGSNDLMMNYYNSTLYYRATYIYGNGLTIGDIMRSWFDESEYADLMDEIIQVPLVSDSGQDYLSAAQEFCEKYEGLKLKTSPGSAYRYSFVKCEVEEAMDATNLARSRGELDDNGYAFWVTVYFVPENDRAMQQSMPGNTYEYTYSDPDIPAGAYVYTRCGYITQTEYGWVGEIVGTSW